VRQIQFLATEPHYQEHLRPVYDALPVEVRGQFCTHPRELVPGMLTVVSSYKNLIQTSDQPIVFFEHGSGFQYNVRHDGYAGAKDRDRVVLFCNTNQLVADANERSHPNIKSVIVGCPKMDELVHTPKPSGTPVVAFSWHWECRVVPETRSAWPYYMDELERLKPTIWAPLGHSHPRATAMVRSDYEAWGWQYTPSFKEVCAQASVYVCDTSSTIYEFAALDRPVILLNAPWYRRNVHHGLRFWDHIPGIQVDHPERLPGAIERALTDDTWGPERRRITELVYPYLGSATERAAAAILDLL